MSADMSRWLLIVVLVICLLGLLLFARGSNHHRGDEVGALTTTGMVAGR